MAGCVLGGAIILTLGTLLHARAEAEPPGLVVSLDVKEPDGTPFKTNEELILNVSSLAPAIRNRLFVRVFGANLVSRVIDAEKNGGQPCLVFDSVLYRVRSDGVSLKVGAIFSESWVAVDGTGKLTDREYLLRFEVRDEPADVRHKTVALELKRQDAQQYFRAAKKILVRLEDGLTNEIRLRTATGVTIVSHLGQRRDSGGEVVAELQAAAARLRDCPPVRMYSGDEIVVAMDERCPTIPLAD